jgi:hypothetical protein
MLLYMDTCVQGTVSIYSNIHEIYSWDVGNDYYESLC